MTTVNITPEPHQVFNEFDSQGVLLGLARLKNEKNSEYKQRLFDVFVRRANSTYIGLINGITRELGLKIVESLSIAPVMDVNGIPLVTNPGVVFKNTKCILYSDFCNNVVLLEIDRFNPIGNNFTIGQLITTINNTGMYSASLLADGVSQGRSMAIFNQSSVETIPFEDISNSGLRVRLENINLIPDSVSVSSSNLIRRRTDNSNNLKPGEYFINLQTGTIITAQIPAIGSIVRYKFRKDNFIVETSPVIIHEIQSEDFRTKMFEQVLNESGTASNGLPTALGSDLINELLSTFASSWAP